MPGAEAPAAPELPSAESVVSRFVEAVGGRAALAGLGGLRAHATQGEGERAMSLQVAWHAPASMRIDVHLERDGRTLDMVQSVEGSKAWTQRGDAPPSDLHGVRTAPALREAELLPAFVFSPAPEGLQTVATGHVGDRPAVVLEAAAADGITDRFTFDAETGLLLRRAYSIPTPLGPIPQEIDFSDWREVSGVKVPFVQVTRQPGESSTLTFDSFEKGV